MILFISTILISAFITLSFVYYHYPALGFSPATSNQTTTNTTTMDETVPSFLKVVILVDNTGGGSAKSSDFTVYITGPSPSPGSVHGSEDGSIVAMDLSGIFGVDVTPKDPVNANYGKSYSGDCKYDVDDVVTAYEGYGSIKVGDKKTCIITMVAPPNF
jgi:hypothetical protein